MKQGDVVADRFEILRLAGEGGMGVVYQALDRASGDRVALKVLHRGGESYASRFAREAEVLADLEHPGIVRHIAHGATASTELYLAMEWLEGEDLAQRLARAPLTIEESVTLARHAAAALGAAHDRGVVHRDVKPSNLLLVGGDVERVKLLDFGIARVEAGTMTITGITFGTPGYMAPEQARGARELDARADIFALGSVLFQCLTGRAAFVGEHLMAVLAKIVLEEAPRVRELRHDVPRALDQLVARMLAKAPDLRPRDGHELAAELAALGPLVGSSPASIFPFAPESSLTPGEQRLLCVVLAGSPRSPPVVISSGGGADRGANRPPSSGGATSPPHVRIAPGDLTVQSSAGAQDARATPQAEPGAPVSTPPASGVEPSGPGADPADRPEATLIAARSATTVTLQRLREAAALCDARIEQLADGSVIATLTGGQSATDQAAQAARCALAIRAHMPGLPVVLATGRGVMAGRLPVGAAIDRAVELLRTAPRADPAGEAQDLDSVRLDEVTAGLLDARFDVTGEPGSHRLRREREMPEANRTLLGRPTPCVGRERELLTLDATLVECVDEPVARAVLVTAPAGIGKSRLASEFLLKLADRGPIEVWTGRGDPVSAGSPFGMIAPALRRAAGVLEGEPVAVRRKKLAARVGRHLRAEDASRVIAFLGELVGVPFEERAAIQGPCEASVQLRAAREDVMLMGDQMRRAWEDFLAAECAAQPVLIVLEDLHWGDLPSVKLVDAALRHLRHQPLMVLALARPEVRELFPGLWAERSVLELRLDELSRRASERLARHVLGASVSAGTVSKLVAQADGNAFYLEELIRAVADGRGDSLPETVLAMVQARLEGLKPEERLVLRAASVFGQVFWRGGVRALLGGDASFPLAACLQGLEEREIITRARTAAQDGTPARAAGEPKGAGDGGGWQAPREEEHAFRHSLVREAAYGMLTDADRTLGHKLAGEWLERMGEVEAIGLAEHFERGGEPERARRWYLRAAEQALGGNDLGAAIVRSERGAQNGATGEELGAIRLLQAEALRWRGEHADAQSRAIEAMRWLPRGSPRWFSAAGEVALGSARVGAYEPLTDLVDDLCAPDAPVSRQLVVALVRAALSLLFAGRSEIAARIFARIDEVEPQLPDDPAVMAVIHRLRANRAASVGDPSGYLRGLEATIACFERAGDARNACNARANAGHACMELGAYAEAERTLREVLSTAERLGLSTVAAAAKHNLGLTLMRRGAIDAGLSAEIEAVDAFHAQGERRLEGASRMYLAMILAAAGRLEDAEREALCAVDLVASLYGGSRAAALAVLASVRLARGHAEGALAAAAEAMQVLERLGGLEEGESLCRLMHAEALHATGDASAARAVIAAARDRLLARADRIGDPASRASFLERVPENARILALAEAWAGAPTG